ncbi:GTPase HflX [Sphingomonas sp. LY29]|uniref:GTPase HflX n=1 Tax=Sphingomonas sp. LY29 TaxID=3095341 RepID=UPI002D76FE47|nr:GTPase HflX [Sphingomonas sp. LY29]WRP27017.1 GTPase HflX [Sphingomonas sp. LY29]
MSVFNRQEDNGLARGERAMLVLPDRVGEGGLRSIEARLDEARGLAEAIGIEVVGRKAFRLRQVRPASLFGKGQADEIAELARDADATLLIVDASLSPVQQKTLEDLTKCKVIDRTGLILEIFGERAATAEGRLQVELAHLDYQAGRLVRSWTHLERQRGGFGFLGGPGETQIEADRRQIRDRMAKIRKELEQVTRTRGLHRGRRQKAPWPVIALVGYTNAGKSTLFNRMTQASVMAEDLLFATLDPTMRQVRLPGFDKAILSDTVGFVSNLPTELVAAFRATLEEVASADLILHVRDISHPDSDAQAADVTSVLASLGLDEDDSPPRMEVWNKIDLMPAGDVEAMFGTAGRREDVIAVSAVTGAGVEELREAVAAKLSDGSIEHDIDLDAGDGPRIAWLHARGEVVSQHGDDEKIHVKVKLSPENWSRFQRL